MRNEGLNMRKSRIEDFNALTSSEEEFLEIKIAVTKEEYPDPSYFDPKRNTVCKIEAKETDEVAPDTDETF